MIHIVYGTRAELIKFSTLIEELERRKIIFKLVDNGQHDTTNLRKSLRIRKPDYFLGKSFRHIWSKLEANPLTYLLAVNLSLIWGMKVFSKLLKIFSKEGDIVIFHGNTMSVPLVIAAARLSAKKLKLVHLESGLRARTKRSVLLDFLYKLGDHNSDLLFAPYKSCEKNLFKEKINGRIVYSGDIIFDVVKRTVKIKPSIKIQKTSYVLANLSRSIVTENDAEEIVGALSRIKEDVILSVNPVIKNRLVLFGVWKKLTSSHNIKILAEVHYVDFLHLLLNSRAVITDSAGVQEECFALGKPCAITNDFIQFPELQNSGIIKVTGCNSEKILAFINSKNQITFTKKSKNENATKKIVDELENLI